MRKNPSLHPIISLSLFTAGMAATFVLVSSLCIMRKKLPPLSSSSQQKSTDNPHAVSQSWNEVTVTTTLEMTMESPSTITIELEDMKDMS
ncbi:hypothetical protein ACSBR2_040480 [Camellia fascicularis]